MGVVVRPATDFGDDLDVAFLQPVRPRHHEVHAEPIGHVGDGNGVSAVVVDGPHQDVQPLVRHRPRGEATAVGAALLDGAQVRSSCGRQRRGGERDAREKGGIRRIRQTGDLGHQPGRPGRDPEVVQCRPAADDEVAPRGVGGCQPARLVGVQLDAVADRSATPTAGCCARSALGQASCTSRRAVWTGRPTGACTRVLTGRSVLSGRGPCPGGTSARPWVCLSSWSVGCC